MHTALEMEREPAVREGWNLLPSTVYHLCCHIVAVLVACAEWAPMASAS